MLIIGVSISKALDGLEECWLAASDPISSKAESSNISVPDSQAMKISKKGDTRLVSIKLDSVAGRV